MQHTTINELKAILASSACITPKEVYEVYRSGTPWNINLEPENHPPEKEPSFLDSMLNFGGLQTELSDVINLMFLCKLSKKQRIQKARI